MYNEDITAKITFDLANKHPKLDKKTQDALWWDFKQILDLCDERKLSYTNTNINKLKKSHYQIVSKGLKSKDKLLLSMQALVIKVVKDLDNNKVDDGELMQAGNLGLLTALYKFNPAKGTKFSSYAFWWIKAAIFDVIYGVDLVVVPARVKKQGKYNYSFISTEDEDRLLEFSNDDVVLRSSVNDILNKFSKEDQELLTAYFELESGQTLFNYVLFKEISFDDAENRVNKLLTQCKKQHNYY